jgi:trans-aconitate methyltransferase
MSLNRTVADGIDPADGDYWAFLDTPSEQLRHAVVAVAVGAVQASLPEPGIVADLGCGRGHLLSWLSERLTAGYLGIDSDARMLAGITHARIPVETVAVPLEEFDPAGRSASVLVCSEVLYYLDAVDRLLLRLVSRFTGVQAVIVTSVVPRPDRPNWQRSIDRMNHSLKALGWSERERIRISSLAADQAWDIVVLDPNGQGTN